MTDRVEFLAQVKAFASGAMFEHLDDGSFAVFDATTLEITEPPEEAGRPLVIFHDRELPQDSGWRRSGQRVRFQIPQRFLGADQQLFTAALEGLRFVDDPVRESGS